MRRVTGYLAMIGLLLVGACAKPARVTLYDQRASEKATSADRHSGVRRVYPPARSSRRDEVSVAPLAVRPVKANTARPLDATRKQYRPIPRDGRHRVAAKETVYAVSRLYGVPVQSLIRVNRLQPPYSLRIGQDLRLPTQRTHLVARGETVYGIARQYGVSLKELVSLNGVGKPYIVKVGETLLLPDSEPDRTDTNYARAAGDGDGSDRPPAAGETRVRQAERASLRRTVVMPRPDRLSSKGFMWPVKGRVLSRFGAKGKGLYNDGINIAVRSGEPVYAAQHGVVVYRGNELRGFGNLVLIKHDNGYMTAYGHNAELLVARGQKVQRGQVIARAGGTGNVETPQLHFEIRKRRRAVDPLKYLGQRQAADRPRVYAMR